MADKKYVKKKKITYRGTMSFFYFKEVHSNILKDLSITNKDGGIHKKSKWSFDEGDFYYKNGSEVNVFKNEWKNSLRYSWNSALRCIILIKWIGFPLSLT